MVPFFLRLVAAYVPAALALQRHQSYERVPANPQQQKESLERPVLVFDELVEGGFDKLYLLIEHAKRKLHELETGVTPGTSVDQETWRLHLIDAVHTTAEMQNAFKNHEVCVCAWMVVFGACG